MSRSAPLGRVRACMRCARVRSWTATLITDTTGSPPSQGTRFTIPPVKRLLALKWERPVSANLGPASGARRTPCLVSSMTSGSTWTAYIDVERAVGPPRCLRTRSRLHVRVRGTGKYDFVVRTRELLCNWDTS